MDNGSLKFDLQVGLVLLEDIDDGVKRRHFVPKGKVVALHLVPPKRPGTA